MKALLINLRSTVVSGFLFLLPVVVVLVIVTKVWTALTSAGGRLAAMFGMKSILGLGGPSAFAGLLLLAICLLCGWLVRFRFMARVSRVMEQKLASHIPGYDTYRAMAEEKLQNKTRTLPYTAALLRHDEYWRPAYIVERDNSGNVVLFLPEAPDTNRGQIILASDTLVLPIPSATANQLDAALKNSGKGLLRECGVQVPANLR